MPRAAGVAGFHTVHIQIGAPQQAVAVRLTDLIEGKFFLFMDNIFIRHISDQCLGQQRHIFGGTVLPFGIQSVNRFKMGICQANLFGVTVHLRNKGFLTARDIFRQRNTGIITGLNDHPFVQID